MWKYIFSYGGDLDAVNHRKSSANLLGIVDNAESQNLQDDDVHLLGIVDNAESQNLQDVDVDLLGIVDTGARNSTMLMSNSVALLIMRSQKFYSFFNTTESLLTPKRKKVLLNSNTCGHIFKKLDNILTPPYIELSLNLDISAKH
jgi:hypothetical protein